MTHTVSPGLNSVLLLERDRGGRFAPGNRGGPGNPFAREMAAFRAMIFHVVQPQDVEKAVRKLVELACEGHFPAIKLLLLYTLGKPTAPLEYDQGPADGLPPACDEATASPSTNADARRERGGDSPSTNGERPDDVGTPPAANESPPSTNGDPAGAAAPARTAQAQAAPSTN